MLKIVKGKKFLFVSILMSVMNFWGSLSTLHRRQFLRTVWTLLKNFDLHFFNTASICSLRILFAIPRWFWTSMKLAWNSTRRSEKLKFARHTSGNSDVELEINFSGAFTWSERLVGLLDVTQTKSCLELFVLILLSTKLDLFILDSKN